MTPQHAACTFVSIASVHAWERVGAAIAHIARKFLKIAALRYVDDLFAQERCADSLAHCFSWVHVCTLQRRSTMKHALQCLVRLIKILLGPTAVAPKKIECGTSRVVLGVRALLFLMYASVLCCMEG